MFYSSSFVFGEDHEVKKELLKDGKTVRFFYDPENNGTLHIWYENNIPISFQLSYMDIILEWKGKKEIFSGKVEETKEELKYIKDFYNEFKTAN